MARILVSLGGNALGTEFDALVHSVGVVAGPIVSLLQRGHAIVICHGNGPQVGMIKTSLDHGKTGFKDPDLPLSEAVAMSQAYIGYHLQNAIQNQLAAHGMQGSVVDLISRSVVDPDDPGFGNPTKPIGAFFSLAESKELEALGKTMVEDSGRGYREVVASPMPQRILEEKAILDLVAGGHLVIAGGGGGIPVVEREGWFKAIDAVIDKDHTSVLMAKGAQCDVLVMLTGVEQVSVNFNKPDQRELDQMSLVDCTRYIGEGQFPAGSMLPKIQAAMNFVGSGPNRRALITSLDKLVEGLSGETGTWITA
ncbi:carbamate kinase [Propionibacterium sp.]|uniref:carbamate kinase n=1 Tax=Propionibacterium sp. TaxID=1977903 RepID=UPI0039E91E70